MARSYRSSTGAGGEDDERIEDTSRTQDPQNRPSRPQSPLLRRRTYSTRSLEYRLPIPDENSSLLDNADGGNWGLSYRSLVPSTPQTPRPQRQHSYSTNARFSRNLNHSYTFSQRLVNALSSHNQSRERALGGRHSVVCLIRKVLICNLRCKPYAVETIDFLHKRACMV
jgi:hypothetical protein